MQKQDFVVEPAISIVRDCKNTQELYDVYEKLKKTSYVENEYIDNSDDTITDMATGLMWQKSALHMYTIDSERYVKKLPELFDGYDADAWKLPEFASYDDWRAPDISELMSLIEIEKQSHGLYINPLFDEIPVSCASSNLVPSISKKKRNNRYGWLVRFDVGLVLVSSMWYRFLRPVRSIT